MTKCCNLTKPTKITMKKILFTACLALGTAFGTYANTLTIVNMTGCTIYGITQGGAVTASPGNTYFASPANISNPSATPSGTFTGFTFDVDPAYTNPVYTGTGAYSSCSTTSGTSTLCNGGTSFCWSWTVAPNNIVLIFY
jgi:hypothetical protein